MITKLRRMLFNLPLVSTILLIFSIWNFSTFDLVQCLPSKTKSLYTYIDPVNILYSSNISEFISRQHIDGHKLQLVQFYNSWCGHCIDFAPIFKEFLKSISRWRQWLDVSVMDCSIDENYQSGCSKYEVTYFPLLKMFWFKPDEKNLGEELIQSHKTPESLRKAILDWVTRNWSKGSIPSDWPTFVPITATTVEELNTEINWQDNRPVVLIVETKESYIGRELMTHFFRWRNEVKFYRLVDTNVKLIDSLLPNALNKFKLPFLFVAKSKENGFKILPKKIDNVENDLLFYRKMIEREFLKHISKAELEEDNVNRFNNDRKEAIKPILMKETHYADKVFMSDLLNSIRYSLFTEVLRRKELNRKQANALSQYLAVILHNFPFPNIETKNFIRYIYEWFKKILHENELNSIQNIKTTKIKEILNESNKYHKFPKMQPWVGCANIGINRHEREFPCSLWKLFHVLTVIEYQRAMDLGYARNVHETLFTMREFVSNFFSCRGCAEHFMMMAKELDTELTHMNSSVLWLWHAHNRVNLRLKGTTVDNPVLPKRQFPTINECSECFRKSPPTDNNEHRNATEFRLTYYNEPKVLEFLVLFYRVDQIILNSEKLDDESKHNDVKIMASKESKLFSYVSFTKFDYSIWFMCYIVSISLLVSIYFLVKLKKSRRNRRFNF